MPEQDVAREPKRESMIIAKAKVIAPKERPNDYIETIEDYRPVMAVDQFEPSPEDRMAEESIDVVEGRQREFALLKLRAETLILRLSDLHRLEMRKDSPDYDKIHEVAVEVGGLEALTEHLPLIENRVTVSTQQDGEDAKDVASQLDMFERRVELFERESGNAYVPENAQEEVESGFEPDVKVIQPESADEIRWNYELEKGPKRPKNSE